MRSVVSWLVLSCAACSSTPVVAPQVHRAAEVTELGGLPVGYAAADTIRAGCSQLDRSRAFADEPLSAVDCSLERLSRVLRAKAGDASGLFIFGKRCRTRGGSRRGLECSATIARAGRQVALADGVATGTSAPAPSAEQVLDLDEPRPEQQDAIWVGFIPARARPRAAVPRNYAAVEETHVPSVGRAPVGQVSAHCAGCEPHALRFALRATAGQLGAGEITGVKCFQEVGALRCVATALSPWSS